ncbi:MAG: DUF7662 domain-containing protein [Acidimicrobiales bacterium]
MGKYDPLFEHLCRAPDAPVDMTFDEIATLVGALPPSATRSPSWWANTPGGSRNVQAHAWLNAGREVERVDRAAGRVRFSSPTWRRGS